MDENLPKFWSSKQIINNTNNKLFTKLSVVADKNVKFILSCEGKDFQFTTYKAGLNEFMFKISCKEIKLIISSNEESAEVESASLEYYEY